MKDNLYKPTIVKKEVDDEHYYFVDGEFYPGVTTILSGAMPMPYALRQWIGDVGNEKAENKMNKAADRGSAIHHACEKLLYGGTINLKEEFPDRKDQKCLVAFKDWVAEIQPTVQKDGIEMTVASKYKFAGTLDIFCYIDGEPWIIDIKTSSNVYDSHKLQIMAYKQAFKEMTGIEANTGILHLNYKTKKGYSFYTDLKIKKKAVTIEDFMTVYEMYKMINGGVIPEPPMIDLYPEKLNLTDNEEN